MTNAPTVDDLDAGTVTVDLDASSRLQALALTGTSVNDSFDDTLANESISDTGAYLTIERTAPETVQGRIGDPATLGLSYHTFGAWETIDGMSGTMTAVVFGEPTAVGGLPGGSATYNGRSAGVYVNEDTGDRMLTTSNMTAVVNFGLGSIDFDTTGTTGQEGLGGATTAMSGLNASGTLMISGTGFDGAITTTSGMTGDASGIFAGPAAEELGGTLFASDADGAYTAGFGGKR